MSSYQPRMFGFDNLPHLDACSRLLEQVLSSDPARRTQPLADRHGVYSVGPASSALGNCLVYKTYVPYYRMAQV